MGTPGKPIERPTGLIEMLDRWCQESDTSDITLARFDVLNLLEYVRELECRGSELAESVLDEAEFDDDDELDNGYDEESIELARDQIIDSADYDGPEEN